MHVLLVEDNALVASGVKAGLQLQGFGVDVVGCASQADAALKSSHFDVCVLDLGLPDEDGLHLLARWRRQGLELPVLVLTARDAVDQRIEGLQTGADDYLVKPFALDELLARVRALARRPREGGSERLHWDALQVDTHARRARWQGHDLQLSPKEYALLELLLRQRGRVLTRQMIFARLYDSASDASDKVVEVILSTLRSKLGKAGVPDPIATRRGFGYVIE